MNQPVFTSKKGVVIGLLLFLTVGLTVFILIWEASMNSLNAAKMVISLAIIAFCLWMWFGTYYRFEENSLLVCTGPLRWRIPYESITKIKPSRSILSSAALSFDQLAIYKDDKLNTLISPKEKAAFLAECVKRCTRAVIVRSMG